MKLFMITMFALMFTGSAMAGDFYVTGNINATDADVNGFNLDDTQGGGVGLGWNYNNWLAAEVTYDDLGSGTTSGLTHDTTSAGLWVVADPVVANVSGHDIKIIGRIGVTDTQIATNVGNFSSTSLAYGIGAGVEVTNDVDVSLNYTNREINDSGLNFNFNTVSLAVKYEF